MIEWLRGLFAKRESSIDSIRVSGSQRSLETEQQRFLLGSFGLQHPFNLNDYLTLYVEDNLAKAIVDADVNLTVSEFVYGCENDNANEYLEDFNNRVDMDRVIWEQVRDTSLYGFGISEIVGNGSTLRNSTEVIAIKRIDPRYIVIQKDRRGRIQFFRQRPSATFPVPNASPFLDVELDPESIIYTHSLSPLTSYGQSILQSLQTRLAQRNDLIDAHIKALQRNASPIYWLRYQGSKEGGETQTEMNEHVAAMKAATDEFEAQKNRFINSAGMGEYSGETLGAGQIPDSAQLLRDLTQEIISSAGFSPDCFGLGAGSKNVEGVRYTTNSIAAKQNLIMRAFAATLYSRLPFIESACPGTTGEDLRVSMMEPTQESLKEGLEAEAIRINNVGLKLKMGVIGPDQAARELDYQAVFDKELTDQFAQSLSGETNGNDPNQQQQVNKSLNRGGAPGNNPTGGGGG